MRCEDFLLEGLKLILALQGHNARLSGQVFPVEGFKHMLALQKHNARLSCKILTNSEFLTC